jgi:spermidine synthase
MAFWYETDKNGGMKLKIKVNDVLPGSDPESDFWILDTLPFGKVVLNVNTVMRTSSPVSPWHEMLIHVPMNTPTNPSTILLVGGSDGMSLELLLSYPSVKSVTIVGSVPNIIGAVKKLFPKANNAFSDSRVHIVDEPVQRFVRDCQDHVDMICFDSTESPSGIAFPQSFFCDCFRLLESDGVMSFDCGGFSDSQSRKDTVSSITKVKHLFPYFSLYSAPSKPNDGWGKLFGLAAKTFDASKIPSNRRFEKESAYAQWYRADLHSASFALPGPARALLDSI